MLLLKKVFSHSGLLEPSDREYSPVQLGYVVWCVDGAGCSEMEIIVGKVFTPEKVSGAKSCTGVLFGALPAWFAHFSSVCFFWKLDQTLKDFPGYWMRKGEMERLKNTQWEDGVEN